MPVAPLRGFRDYPPPEAGARSLIRAAMRAVARRSGYVELETPSVESLELFQVKSGEEIGKELWAFTDKGGRNVTLAAESTPSLARVFAERAKAEPLPAKWFTVAKLWRYEEPQGGRTREFTQFNLDILGAPAPAAEVDLLLTVARLLDAAGAAGLYQIRVNDRGLAEGIGRTYGATDLLAYFRALDRSRKGGLGPLRADLEGAGLSPESVDQLVADLAGVGEGVPAAEALPLLDGWAARGLERPGPEGIARLRTLFDLLAGTPLKDRVRFDLSLVRGFAYYTSLVFEGFDLAGEGRSLFGGGRYDGLIELFGGPPTPACGLALGDQTLERLLRSAGRWPEGEPALDTYVVAVTAAEVPVAFEIAEALRGEGVSADVDLMGRPLSRQLKEAARRRARRAIIVGPKELARGLVVERDLTTGAQREIPRSSPSGDGGGPRPAPA